MKVIFQEDLRKWVEGPEGANQKETRKSEEDRRKWTMMQAEQLYSEVKECTLPELELLCKKSGILVWSIKYYTPDFFQAVLRKSKNSAIQDIIEELETGELYSPHQLKTLVKQKNTEYGLDRYHGEISCDDIEKHAPDRFSAVFKQRYFTLPDIIDDDNPPRYRKVFNEEHTR